MSIYELIELTSGINNRIDIQWGLFITVHMALFGGIIYVDRPLRLIEKIPALMIYSGFAFVNYKIMVIQFESLKNIYLDVADLAAKGCCDGSHIVGQMLSELDKGKFEISFQVLDVMHVVMFVLVVLSIVFDKALSVRQKVKASG